MELIGRVNGWNRSGYKMECGIALQELGENVSQFHEKGEVMRAIPI